MRLLPLIVFIPFFCCVSYALDMGDSAPELKILKWVRGGPVVLYPKNAETDKERNVYVIFFWATWNSSSLRLLDFVEKEEKLYGDDGVVFLGISKENISRVNNFLDKISDVNFSLGIDDKAYTYDKYMLGTRGTPMFFIIGKNGKLVWKGSPFEVDSVLSRVISGTFNIVDQVKIEKLRENIIKSSHVLDNMNKVKAALNTLKIDPTDETAINIVVDNYIRKKQVDKAVGLVKNAREKAKGNIFLLRNLYYIELSIIRGTGAGNAKSVLVDLTKSFYDLFYNRPVFLSEFAVMILENAPFEIWPLLNLLKMTERAVKLEKKRNGVSEKLGVNLQTLARVYYYLGWYTKAIIAQSYAAPLLKDEKDREIALLKEKYYMEVLNINKNLK